MKTKYINRLFFITVILLCIGLSGLVQAAWETVIPSNSFSNFNSYWSQYYPWGQTHNGSAKMETYQVHVNSGVLNIQAQQPGNDGYKYRSGAINSQDLVTVNDDYPSWEVKGEFRAPSETGAWPAFWLTGAWGWPPEIDIMEFKGDNYNWQNTYDGGWETKTTWISNPWDWTEYRIWMTKDGNNASIHFYINGNWQAHHTGSNFAGQPMDVIINLQMEGSSGSPGPWEAQMYARNVYVGCDNLSGGGGGGGITGTKCILNRASGRAMDVYNIENENGANICIWDYWGGQGQRWIITDIGGDLYTIRTVMTGNRSIDVWNGATGNGVNIALYTYYANPQQKFYIDDLGNGYYRITPSHDTNVCVDAYGTSNGSNVGTWSYWGGNNQQWSIEDP